MSEDVVEIIEIYPEIIEISDEECEDVVTIVKNCNDSTIVSANGDNANVLTVDEESTKTPAKTVAAVVNVNANNHNDKLPSVEPHTVKQTNTNLASKKNSTLRKSIGKKRKILTTRKVHTIANGVNTVQMSKKLNDICHKVGSSDSPLPNSTESSIRVTKQEMESTEANALQNDRLLKNSNINESPASSTMPAVQPENTPSQRTNYDFSKLSWLKPLNNLSSPPHLQLVIIDRGHPDWKIETTKWLMVEKRLLESLHAEMLRSNDRSIGLFDGAKWQRGIKVVGCHNKKALNFIKNFILNLDKLWAGANLDVCTMSHFVRQICKVFIPPPILKTDVVLSLIKLQNPSICSEDWEVLGEQERNRGIDLWISVNEESFEQLCRLRGEIKFGINRVFINPVL